MKARLPLALAALLGLAPVACAKSYVIPVKFEDRVRVPHGRLIVVNESTSTLSLLPRDPCKGEDRQGEALEIAPQGSAGLRLSVRGVEISHSDSGGVTSYEIEPDWSEYLGPALDQGPRTVLLHGEQSSAGSIVDAELRLDFEAVAAGMFQPWRSDGDRPERPTYIVVIDKIADGRQFGLTVLETCAKVKDKGVEEHVPACR